MIIIVVAAETITAADRHEVTGSPHLAGRDCNRSSGVIHLRSSVRAAHYTNPHAAAMTGKAALAAVLLLCLSQAFLDCEYIFYFFLDFDRLFFSPTVKYYSFIGSGVFIRK